MMVEYFHARTSSRFAQSVCDRKLFLNTFSIQLDSTVRPFYPAGPLACEARDHLVEFTQRYRDRAFFKLAQEQNTTMKPSRHRGQLKTFGFGKRLGDAKQIFSAQTFHVSPPCRAAGLLFFFLQISLALSSPSLGRQLYPRTPCRRSR